MELTFLKQKQKPSKFECFPSRETSKGTMDKKGKSMGGGGGRNLLLTAYFFLPRP